MPLPGRPLVALTPQQIRELRAEIARVKAKKALAETGQLAKGAAELPFTLLKGGANLASAGLGKVGLPEAAKSASRFSDTMQRGREAVGRSIGEPKTTSGKVMEAGGRVGANVGAYFLGGIPTGLAITGAIAGSDREASTTAALSGGLKAIGKGGAFSRVLDRLAEEPLTRAASDVGLDLATFGALKGAGKLAKSPAVRRFAANESGTMPYRDANGKPRKNLGHVTAADLAEEKQRLIELNASEGAIHGSVQDAGYRHDYLELPRTERLGKKGKKDLPDADGNIDSDRLLADNQIVSNYNRSQVVRAARERAIKRIEAEESGRLSATPDVSFDYGANTAKPVRELARQDIGLPPTVPPKPPIATGGGEPPGFSGDAVAIVRASIASGKREQPRTPLAEYAHKAYTRIVDEAWPLRRFGKELGRSEALSDRITQASGWQASSDAWLETDLKSIVVAAKGHEDGIRTLAKSQRALALSRQGLEKTDIPDAIHQAAIDQLSQIPEAKAGAEAIQGYYRKLLEYKRANGVIDDDQFKAIVESGDFYTPFVRDFGVEGKMPTAGGGRLYNRSTGVRKMGEGKASAKTVDPFEQAVLDTYETHRTVAKQRVTNIVADIVEQNPEAASALIRKVTNPETVRHGRLVQANVRGKRESFEVLDKDLFDAWGAFSPQTQGVVAKVMGPFKRSLQGGVTILPDFAVANGIRDSFMSAVQYPIARNPSIVGGVVGAGAGAVADEENPLRGALLGAAGGAGLGNMTVNIGRTLNAMRDVIGPKLGGNRAIYEEWMREGGPGFGFYAKNSAEARKVLATLKKDGVQPSDIINPKSLWQALQAINRVVEEAPRLARYKYAKAGGAEIPEAVAQSRDISLDFLKSGRDTKTLNQTTAFLNANIQGWDKLTRLLKNPKTWAVGASTITAPTIALWNVNKDNPEYWERPQWERNLFWLLPRGEGKGFYRIPKPFQVGFIFASLPERILDYAQEREPETLAYAMKDMVHTTTDGTFPIPTMVQPILENVTNYDMFRNRRVVSRPDLVKPLQYDNRTSSLAVGIGKAGVSPQQVDHTIRSWTGSAGGMVLDATDRLARATGLDDRPLPVEAKMPLVGRFMTSPAGMSDSEATLRRRFRDSEAVKRSAKALFDRGDIAGFERFVRENIAGLKAYDELKPIDAKLDKISEKRREVTNSRTIDRETKKKMLAALATMAVETAKMSDNARLAGSR